MISISFNSFYVFNGFLINMVAIFVRSAKLVTLGANIIKVFWNNGYEVILLAHDVTNKISSSDKNYIVDVIMWPKFGNSVISMREVTISSIS